MADIPVGINGEPVQLSAGRPWNGTTNERFWPRVLEGQCPLCKGLLEDVSERTTVDSKHLSPAQSWRICRPCIVEVYQHLGRKRDRGLLSVWRQEAHYPSHV